MGGRFEETNSFKKRFPAALKNFAGVDLNSTGSKLGAATVSIIVNIALMALKLFVAIATGSIAVFAELAHSFFDLLASVLAYIGIRLADRPEDPDHHYGHEKFENLSSLAQTLLIVLTSIFIFYEAGRRIMEPGPIEAAELGLIAMLATIAVDYYVSNFLHRASAQYESSALEADAFHFTTDLWSAIAVVIGLAFVYIGFPIFDSIAAIAVAIMMLKVSYDLGLKAVGALSDRSPPPSVVTRMEMIVRGTPGVKGFHKMRARQAGKKILVEVHIQVPARISVARGHEIAKSVKLQIKNEFPNVKDVTVHVEPVQ
jgi:cation diffusion facilitator family transporter